MTPHQLSSPRQNIHIHGTFHNLEFLLLLHGRFGGFLDGNPLQMIFGFDGTIVFEW